MDGLAQSNAQVFVLAATNLPWHLDLVSCIENQNLSSIGCQLPVLAGHMCGCVSNFMLYVIWETALSHSQTGHGLAQTAA